MSEYLYPKYSRATAYRLWKQGKMPDSFYIPNYMTPEEAWEYKQQKAREMVEQARAEEEQRKQIDKEIRQTFDEAMESLLSGLKLQ